MSDKDKLWEICERFVREEHVRCPESIYQKDNVIENAYNLIECICSVVGYYQDSDGSVRNTDKEKA